MAEVWKAYDPQLDRFVAIKILHANLQTDPEFITRFSREARVIASLHHPNIIQVHDFQLSRSSESADSIAYMVMDYVEGQTLAGYILATSRVGKVPAADDILHLFTSISRAIDYAHQQGMIHRDIKPANILLDHRNRMHNPIGEPVLTDFGIAKLMGGTAGTLSGMWMGTPLYISPEQAQGHSGNERSDIYSLGIILYEICTGVQPFRDENISSVMMQHINTAPISPSLINPNISPLLSMVILRSMAKNPTDRYSSASAMTAALAEALNLPIPITTQLPLSQSNAMNEPTVPTPNHPYLPPKMMPSSPPLPVGSPTQLPPTVSSSAPPSSELSPSGQTYPATPMFMFNTPSTASSANSMQNSPTSRTSLPLLNVPSVPFISASSPHNRPRGMLFWLSLLLIIIVLLGSGLGGLYWFASSRGLSAVLKKPVIVGHAYFFSSGQTNESNNQGINDELLIDLHHIPDTSSGKSYYGWLLGDVAQPLAPPIALGKLPINHGDVHYLYSGDVHHTNLIAITSRFLITEEDTNITPINPSPDKGTWSYYVQFPQTPDASQTPTMGTPTAMDMAHEGSLQHTRHLLADAPELTNIGLNGGLDIWLFRNMEKVYEWAGSARDTWEGKDTALMRRQVIRVLDYLDGKIYVQQDMPTGTPNLVNPRIAPLALLEFDAQKQQPPGLLYLINIHLSALIQAPDVSAEKHVIASQIDQESNDVQALLQHVRKDAKRLLTMSSVQLLSLTGLSLLDDMETAARYAFIGQIDPNANVVRGGVVQIHDNIQRLATYDITSR